MIKISLAVPCYNSSKFIRNNLEKVINDDRISEVMVSDDCSNDFDQLKSALNGLPKITIHKNDVNIGAMANKYQAVSMCSNSWSILLDSDNVLNIKYIDALYAKYWGNGDIIYCPSFARPIFDFRVWNNKTCDLGFVRQEILNDRFMVLLNTGNYLVPTREYCNLIRNNKDTRIIPDVMLFNYYWLQAGNKLHVVKDMEYDHTARPDSFWMSNQERGGSEVQTLRAAIIDGKKIDKNLKLIG